MNPESVNSQFRQFITTVQYLFMSGDNEKGGGLCVLMDRDGKPLLAK